MKYKYTGQFFNCPPFGVHLDLLAIFSWCFNQRPSGRGSENFQREEFAEIDFRWTDAITATLGYVPYSISPPPTLHTICTHSCIRHVPTLLYLWGVTQDTEVRTAVGESFRYKLRSLVYRYFVPIQAIISWLVSVPSTDLAVLKVNIIFFDSSHLEKASLYEVILEWLLPHRIVSRLP